MNLFHAVIKCCGDGSPDVLCRRFKLVFLAGNVPGLEFREEVPLSCLWTRPRSKLLSRKPDCCSFSSADGSTYTPPLPPLERKARICEPEHCRSSNEVFSLCCLRGEFIARGIYLLFGPHAPDGFRTLFLGSRA